MLNLRATVFVLVAVSIAYSFSVRGADDAPIKPEDAQRYLDLAVKLGSDDFAEREDAQQKLHAAPFGAFDLLRKALVQSRDAEVQDQLRSVLIGLAFNFCAKSRGFKISLKASNTPLKGVLENIARQMGLEADTFSSIFSHATLARLVSVEFNEMKDRFAVRWLFRLANVEPRAPSHPVDGSYDLAGLPVKPATLAFLLKDRWMAIDFQNPGSLGLDGSRLSVHANSDVHEKIAIIIKQMRQQKDSKRIAIDFDDDAQLRDSIDAMLQKNKVSFDLVNTPLTEAVEQIGKIASVPILIDPRIISAGPPPVTLRVTDMSARTALEWLAKLSSTCIAYKDHGVCLTTPENRGGQQCLILNLDEMIHTPGQHITLPAVADMLRQRVRPDLWDAALGTSVEERDDRLFIMQYPEVVAQIEELLDRTSSYIALCKKVEKNGQWPDHPLDPADVPAEEPQKSPAPPWIQELKTKLTTKEISFDYDAKPLAEVLDAISKALGAPIILDPRMTADGTSRTPITLRVKDMDAQHALQWVLKLADLDFELRENAVFVSRKANMSVNVTLRVYYVRDLHRVLRVVDLVTVLHDRLLAANFADQCTSIAENDGALLVMQRPEVHQQIEFMLTALRLNWKDKTLMLCPLAMEDAKEPDVRLLKKVPCQFKDAALPDVLKTLQEQSGIAIELAPNLKEALEKSTTKLNLSLPNATLLEALVHALEPWHPDFALKAGALFVSPKPEKAINVPLTIYNLDGIKNKTGAEIVDLVIRTIDPQSWDAALGTSVEHLNGRLIVLQSPENHRQIAALLEKLRNESEGGF